MSIANFSTGKSSGNLFIPNYYSIIINGNNFFKHKHISTIYLDNDFHLDYNFIISITD
jgi:hypothetical protein